MVTVGADEAKTLLPRLLDRVASGETITITRHGKPVALLVPPSQSPPQNVVAIIAEIRESRGHVKSDPEGWTTKQLVEAGRRP